MFDGLIKEIIRINQTYSKPLLEGLKVTCIIAVSAFAIGIVIGTIVAIVKVVPKKKNYFLIGLEKIFDVYVMIFRGTPIVVQLLLLYFAILVPLQLSAVTVAIIGFGLNSGAYASEIMRAGIMSIDKGQMEAGRSLGLGYIKTMIKIIIPQAIKNIIPTLGNELIAIFKETSVAGFITIVDVTVASQRIVSREYKALAPYMNLALIYFVIVLILTFIMKFIERRLRASDRRN